MENEITSDQVLGKREGESLATEASRNIENSIKKLLKSSKGLQTQEILESLVNATPSKILKTQNSSVN